MTAKGVQMTSKKDEIEEIRQRFHDTYLTRPVHLRMAEDFERLLRIIAEKDAEIARLKRPACRCGWEAPAVPQVCEEFVRETRPCPEMGTCVNCEHDEECHS
jgi:hypothetical protein